MSEIPQSARDVTAAIREALTPAVLQMTCNCEGCLLRREDVRDAILAALRPVIAGHEDWWPIATAPEAENVLVWLPNYGPIVARRTERDWWGGSPGEIQYPSHWQRIVSPFARPSDAHAAGVGPEPERKGPKCINCGVDDDGGYMAEDGPGPFCSLCWGALEDEFIKRAPNMSETAPAAPGEGETITLRASYVLGGFEREATDDAALLTAIRDGMRASPIGEVTIRFGRADTAWGRGGT